MWLPLCCLPLEHLLSPPRAVPRLNLLRAQVESEMQEWVQGTPRPPPRLLHFSGNFQEKGVNEIFQQHNWISWLLLASQPLCGRTCGHRVVPASAGPAGEAAPGQPGEEAGVNPVRAMHFCSVRRFGWVSFVLRSYVTLDDTKLLFANGFDLFTVIGFNKWEILSLH